MASVAAKKYGDDCVEIWHDRKRWCGMPLSFTRYSIVEKPGKWCKLIVDKGLLTSQIEEVNVFRIDDTSIFESFTNKIWGTGTLKVYCKDASDEIVNLVRIKNPSKVRNLINELIENDRQARNVQYGEMQF